MFLHKNNFFSRLSLIPVLFLFTSMSFAQMNSGNLSQLLEINGLPGVQVNEVLVDRSGYIWTGTINGLARYDGYNFKRFYFNPNDTNTIHGLIVWSLFEDSRGHIWTGTSPSYLNEYNPATQKFGQYKFGHLVKHPDNVELNVRAIEEDNEGRLYFGVDTYYGDVLTSTLLYKDKEADELKVFPVPGGIILPNIITIKKDKEGNLWLLSYSGIFKLDKNRVFSKFTFHDKEIWRKNDFAGDYAFDSKGHLWIMMQDSRLYETDIRAGTFKMYYPKEKINSKEDRRVSKILFDKSDNIWIGTNKGLQYFDRKREQFYAFDNGARKELERVAVSDLVFDSFGTLWIGSYDSGLLKYEERSQLKSYSYNKDEKNSLTSGWANTITETSDGRILIATSGSDNSSLGINFLNPRTGELKRIFYSQISNPLYGNSYMWESSPGEYFLGTYDEVFLFSEKSLSLKKARFPGIPQHNYISYFLKDRYGNEWICTFRGLYKKEKGIERFKQYDLSRIAGSNGSSNEITQVIESRRNALWIITNNGLFRYDYTTDQIERHGFDKKKGDIFISQDVNSFFEVSDTIAWVGTWQGGLSRYNPDTRKILTYTRNDGLPSMSIQSILPDSLNNTLWLGTFEGLSRFDTATKQFYNYTLADGIQSQLFADRACLKTSGGLFVFGGSNGITIFNPDDINKTSVPPRVLLTDLRLFNKPVLPGPASILKKPVSETEQVTLQYNQNNISLEFIGLHYSNPALNKYRCWLENFDNEWRDIGTQRDAYYPNLPPGKYIFHVSASNDKGVWNEDGVSLSIIVNPPWWKTIMAYTIYAFFLLIAIFLFDRFMRQRIVQKERRMLLEKEAAYAKEIEKAYDSLKATQALLIQSEKMASLGELTAGIAHEIQNPLNFVNNFSEVSNELIEEINVELDKGNIEEARGIATEIKSNLEKINHHGKRAESIVKGMLLHSRSHSGQKEPTDINALSDEYLRISFHGFHAKDKSFNAGFRLETDESLPKIEVVRQDIGRVLLNLINNAFYTVRERSKNEEAGYDPKVVVRTKKTDNFVEIFVQDNGTGIPEDVKSKIFQPFFTTKPAGQGTGLGLSLCYDIVKAHGGKLNVETKEGEGSRFIIQLPVNMNGSKQQKEL